MNGNSKKLPSVIPAMFLAVSACRKYHENELSHEKENDSDTEKAVCHLMTYCRFFILSWKLYSRFNL